MSGLKSAFSWVGRTVPSVIVFAILAAVGYWGHHTGWKAPKWREIFGGGSAATAKEDWCKAHNVPDSACIACHPELAGENPADWCKEHGVPESACTICHPEILENGKADDWCTEHGVPESACNLCHPEIVVKGDLPKDDSVPAIIPSAEGVAAIEPVTINLSSFVTSTWGDSSEPVTMNLSSLVTSTWGDSKEPVTINLSNLVVSSNGDSKEPVTMNFSSFWVSSAASDGVARTSAADNATGPQASTAISTSFVFIG